MLNFSRTTTALFWLRLLVMFHSQPHNHVHIFHGRKLLFIISNLPHLNPIPFKTMAKRHHCPICQKNSPCKKHQTCCKGTAMSGRAARRRMTGRAALRQREDGKRGACKEERANGRGSNEQMGANEQTAGKTNKGPVQ